MFKLKNKIKRLLLKFRFIFKKSDYGSKVFCIGYNKTGTTTIGKSLKLLGYNNSTFNLDIWKKYKEGDIDHILKYTSKFDSFNDLPWNKEELIPILDKTFPSSKFIYSERNEESWKRSFDEWNALRSNRYSNNSEEAFERYLSHKKFVIEYFKNRSKDIIYLEVSDDEGFKKLAKFLEKTPPQNHFPHYNKTDDFRELKKKLT
jgi:hypothetical protein